MTKLIASPVSFSYKEVFLVYVSASYYVTKLTKMDGADFLRVKLFKNFQKTYEELVKWVLQFQYLTKGKGELCKNGKVM